MLFTPVRVFSLLVTYGNLILVKILASMRSMLARIQKIRVETDDTYRITVPAEMAVAMGFKRGAQVLIVQQDGALLIETFQPEDALRVAELKGIGAKFITCGRPRKTVPGPFLPFTVEDAA